MYKLRYEFYNKMSHSNFQTKRLMTGRNILRLKKERIDTFQTVEDKISDLQPLHLYISIKIPHTLFYTFPLLLTRRICLVIKASYADDHFRVPLLSGS